MIFPAASQAAREVDNLMIQIQGSPKLWDLAFLSALTTAADDSGPEGTWGKSPRVHFCSLPLPASVLYWSGQTQFLGVVHISALTGANQIRPAGKPLWCAYKISLFSYTGISLNQLILYYSCIRIFRLCHCHYIVNVLYLKILISHQIYCLVKQ